ncbi:hypothetical protein ACLKA6_009950 [Drosophila palustris]
MRQMRTRNNNSSDEKGDCCHTIGVDLAATLDVVSNINGNGNGNGGTHFMQSSLCNVATLPSLLQDSRKSRKKPKDNGTTGQEAGDDDGG